MSDTNPNQGVGRAWLILCFALAAHVFDEAATGFLAVYNPTVLAVRERLPWFPMPVFTFEVWLIALIALIAGLLMLSPLVYRGKRWTRVVACIFGTFMMLNALGHTIATIFGQTVSTVHFSRPAPGFYSSPLLFAASVYLLRQLRSSVSHPLQSLSVSAR